MIAMKLERMMVAGVGLAAGLALAGCGDSAGGCASGLCGPSDYDLTYDRVDIARQDQGGKLNAIKISYVKSTKGGEESTVVVVVNAPIEVGKDRFIAKNGKIDGGNVYRVVRSGQQFPAIQEAKAHFDSLGKPGQSASGTFHCQFTNGQAVNGEFSGTVKSLTN